MAWINAKLCQNARPNIPDVLIFDADKISAENLDEFYSVRVAGLKELVRENLSRISIDGLSPQEQIEKIEKLTRSLIEKQQIIWKGLLSELKKSGICILSNKDLLISDLKSLEKYFTDQVFPLITPLAIDPAHPFPFITSGGFTLAVRLKRLTDGSFFETLIPIPSQIPRFHRLADNTTVKSAINISYNVTTTMFLL